MMEAANQSEAESKFWKTPELLETFFSWLNLEATLNLARVMDKESLQSGITSKVWNKLIRYNCPVDDRGRLFGGFLVDRDSFHTRYHDLKLQEAQHAVKNLVTILKLMEQPNDLLLDLLDVICEGLPPLAIGGAVRRPLRGSNHLQMVCPRHPEPHDVSRAGFLLLEDIESALGTAEQRIKSMEVGVLNEATISAIGSRMTRQRDPVTSIRIRGTVDIETEKGALAFHTLMSGQIELVQTINLKVRGSVGGEGWEAVAKAMQLQPHLVNWIFTTKPGLAEGKKDDIKKIWDTVGLKRFCVYKTTQDLVDGKGWPGYSVVKLDNDWERLEQILDMTEAEFAAKINEAKDEDGEEEEEEEGDPETGEDDD